MLKEKSKIYTLISLFLLIFIDTMGVGLVWPLFGPLLTDKASSILPTATSIFERDILYGITLGVFPICMFFGAPILGDLSDRIGRKKVLLICLYGTAVGIGICALGVVCRDVILLILGRAILGTLAGSQSTAQATIIDISDPNKKAQSLSIITLATNIGFIAGPMIGGLLINKSLVHWFSITTPFTAAAILAFINATLLLISFKETFHPKNVSNKIDFTKGINVLLSAFKDKQIRTLSIIYLLLQLGWSSYFSFSVLYLVQFHHYNGTKVGYFLSFLSVIFAISSLGIMRAALRFFKLKKITITALFGAGLSLAAATINSEIVTWIVVIPATACVALSYIGMLTNLSNAVSSESQGWVMGIVGSMNAVAWGGSTILSGALGGFNSSIPFMLGAMFLFLAGFLAMRKFRTTNS